MKFLNQAGISCGKLNLEDQASSTLKLFANEPSAPAVIEEEVDDDGDGDDYSIDFMLDGIELPTKEESAIPNEIIEGLRQIVFGHPEAILSPAGRKLLGSEIYQKNVVAIAIDEAHCVETW